MIYALEIAIVVFLLLAIVVWWLTYFDEECPECGKQLTYSGYRELWSCDACGYDTEYEKRRRGHE